ncbi:MAG: hypothetical protein A2033_12465 [Bacteroidetes bacterium GWA2_31_9]|nr:MAG: hypothetical protein A2033_12465 [Bacteroidetes bacterium GWA2_31_9]
MTTRKITWFLTISLFLFCTNTFSQTKYTGYFCTGPNELRPFKYTREYKKEGNDVFITLYKIYSETEGYYLNITATHYKSEQKIVVSIDDITVKSGGHISTSQISASQVDFYSNGNVNKMFGWAGEFKKMYDAQDVLPNDFALKFVSTKFENVKVVHIVKDEQLNSTKWYILDEKN